MPDLDSILETEEGEKAFLDKPRVSLIGYDPFIERGAVDYIKTKYHFKLKDLDIPREILIDHDEYVKFLTNIALGRQDLRIFDRGEIHFKINLTRVATNDLLRHWSMIFKQTGQSKQIDLSMNILKEDAEIFSQKIKYFLPPEWIKKPELISEFNSAVSYAANLIKIAIDRGVPANQAKYILMNATTTDLEISGSLRNFYNLVGLRACLIAQFENQYISKKIAKYLKDSMPNLTQLLGPRCVYERKCSEGQRGCGKIKDQKLIFEGNTTTNLINWLADAEEEIDIVNKVTSFDNYAFKKNYKIANADYSSLKELDELRVIALDYKFRSAPSDLERIVAENAKNTMKLYTGETFPSDEELSEEQIARICRNVTNSGHWGALQHGHIMYDTKISRVMLQKFARHWSLNLMASSQHHTKHSNFEYLIPPAWIEKGLEEEYHIFMRYLNNLYERAMDAGIEKSQARYVLPTAVAVNLRVSANPRTWYSIAMQRTCPSNSWEEREIVTKIVMDLKDRYPNLFYRLGPSCMRGICAEPCKQKDKVRAEFLRS